MESLVQWFTATLSPYITEYAVIFIISLMPILEVRGGLLAASLLKIPELQAIPICVIGNVLPIPIILHFIIQKFKWKKTKTKVYKKTNEEKKSKIQVK